MSTTERDGASGLQIAMMLNSLYMELLHSEDIPAERALAHEQAVINFTGELVLNNSAVTLQALILAQSALTCILSVEYAKALTRGGASVTPWDVLAQLGLSAEQYAQQHRQEE